MKIKIGADELILWLRKNKIAENKTTFELGLKIRKLIEKFGGELTEYDIPCYWTIEPISEVFNEFQLPKSASQYFIDNQKLGDLYIALFNFDKIIE